MGNEDAAECRKRYEFFRHHAWAGLGILSVFLALQYFIALPSWIAAAAVCILSAYILISLMGTYRWYRKGLLSGGEISRELETVAVERAQLKLEKKKIKAELKAKKKAHKK